MSDRPYLSFFVGDYLMATTHFKDAALHGAYLLLIFAAWKRRDAHLPDDDEFLASIAHVGIRRWKRTFKPIIMDGELFQRADDGRWFNSRVLRDRERVESRDTKRKAAGRVGGLKTQETFRATLKQAIPIPIKKKTPAPKKEPREDFFKKDAKAPQVKANGEWARTKITPEQLHDLDFVARDMWAMARDSSLSTMLGRLLKRNGQDSVQAYLVLRKVTELGDPKQAMGRALEDALVPEGKGVSHRRAGAIFADAQGWWRVTDEGGKDRRLIGYKKGV